VGDTPNNGLVGEAASSALAPEPLPMKNERPYIADLVIEDLRTQGRDSLAVAIEERKQFGIKKYGTALQAFNGRRAIVDAYQEVLDGAVYLRQAFEEAVESPDPNLELADDIYWEYEMLLDIAQALHELQPK